MAPAMRMPLPLPLRQRSGWLLLAAAGASAAAAAAGAPTPQQPAWPLERRDARVVAAFDDWLAARAGACVALRVHALPSPAA